MLREEFVGCKFSMFSSFGKEAVSVPLIVQYFMIINLYIFSCSCQFNVYIVFIMIFWGEKRWYNLNEKSINIKTKTNSHQSFFINLISFFFLFCFFFRFRFLDLKFGYSPLSQIRSGLKNARQQIARQAASWINSKRLNFPV